jgi:hypothetical protein
MSGSRRILWSTKHHVDVASHVHPLSDVADAFDRTEGDGHAVLVTGAAEPREGVVKEAYARGVVLGFWGDEGCYGAEDHEEFHPPREVVVQVVCALYLGWEC